MTIIKELTSDRAIGILAFSGLGSQYTRKVRQDCPYDYGQSKYESEGENNIVYISDFSALSAYGVRRGFERYGAIAYFDKAKCLKAIYWSHGNKMVYPPKSEDPQERKLWEHAKWAWKVTMMVHITAIDHLTWTHFIDSATLVKNSVKYLGHKNPLRIFIKPFTYNTANIDFGAESGLINDKGFVHHIAAWHRAQLKDALNFARHIYKFVPIYEKVHPSMRDEPDTEYPFYQDSLRYYEIMEDYVEGFIDNHWPRDEDLFRNEEIKKFYERVCEDLGIEMVETKEEFIDTLTNLFVIVTGFHEHVGTVADFVINPLFACARIEPGYEECSKQNFIQLSALATLTGLKEPDISGDWSHLFQDKYGFNDNDRNNYKEFRNSLKLFQLVIEKRNAESKYKSNSFNPKYIQTSVSV